MLIHTNALCDDAPWIIDSEDLFISYWGSGFLCCPFCESIARTRDAWETLNV